MSRSQQAKKEILAVLHSAQHRVSTDADRFAQVSRRGSRREIEQSLARLHDQYMSLIDAIERRTVHVERRSRFYTLTEAALAKFALAFADIKRAQSESDAKVRFRLLGQGYDAFNRARALQRRSEAALGGHWGF